MNNNPLNLEWDFNQAEDEIEIKQHGKIVLRIGLCEAIDGMNPEFLMRHIDAIMKCPWAIGKWKSYFNKKCLEKFES